jgi:signal transduction histidine kinase/bacteriorhodopsin
MCATPEGIDTISVHRDSGQCVTIHPRDVGYVGIFLLNLVPLFRYLPSVHYDPRETQDVNYFLSMICSALAMMAIINFMSIVQMKFLAPSHRVYVVLVPLVMTLGYGLAATQAVPRLLEPLSQRPIFITRFLSWVCTVPVLIIQSGPLCGYPRHSFVWVAVLTNAYICCAFGALLAPTSVAKWQWICVSYSSWFVTMYETARVVHTNDGKNRVYIYIIHAAFLVYGVLFLCAATDSISVLSENVWFGLCDIFTKAVFSTFIFNDSLAGVYKELDRSMRYAENIVDRSVAPMFVLRCGDGKITRWNGAMAKIVEKSSADVVGKAFIQEFLGDSSKEAQEYFAAALNHEFRMGEKKLVDVRIVQKDESGKRPDHAIDLLLSLNHIENPEGEKVLMCVGQDVTELNSFRLLEYKKAQMLAVVSHELRSPLHGIIGITESIQKSVPKSSHKRKLGLISDCAKRLVDFVSTMMDFTAIKNKSDEFTLNRDPVDLVKLLDNVVVLLVSGNNNDKYGRAVAQNSVTLDRAYRSSSLPSMEGDAYRLTQVFFNIIGNALKFTAKGSVSVSTRIEGERCADKEQHVVVVVKDSGKGIYPSALSRIFEPFEQEDTSDTRQYAGLGLGLAISREIVRKHGGDIEVESQVGVGSIFSIWLPLRRMEADGTSAIETESLHSVDPIQVGGAREITALRPQSRSAASSEDRAATSLGRWHFKANSGKMKRILEGFTSPNFRRPVLGRIDADYK